MMDVEKERFAEVASLADAWIETRFSLMIMALNLGSRPSRTRGLKLNVARSADKPCRVASLADAWIETKFANLSDFEHLVASLADAWIETTTALLRHTA